MEMPRASKSRASTSGEVLRAFCGERPMAGECSQPARDGRQRLEMHLRLQTPAACIGLSPGATVLGGQSPKTPWEGRELSRWLSRGAMGEAP